MLTGWRPALRIARRDVLRSRGRSALVVAMVGLPVALVTALATMYVTNDVSPVESIPSRLGTTAAELTTEGAGPVVQDPVGANQSFSATSTPAAPLTASELQRLTRGSVIDVPRTGTSIRTARGSLSADAVVVDPLAPALAGAFDVTQGRMPRTDTEVLVTRALAARDLGVGSTIALQDGARPATVVGVIATPYPASRDLVVARPGLGLTLGENTVHRYLLDRDRPVLWPEVRALNAAGVGVFSRAVVDSPPSDWRSTLPADSGIGTPTSADTAARTVLALVIFSVVLEVVLLAGPAFAVGVRRQSRQLALVAAVGGTRRDVRRVVLAQSLVLGAGSAVLGAALGLGIAAVAAQVIPRVSTSELGPWEVDWRYVGAALALGALASVGAALFPAISAARADVVAVLSGRRGQAPGRRGWPVVGAALVAAGTALVLTLGVRPGGELMVAFGTLAMVLGAIALMPLLIGLVGRLGSHLPLPLRLATRDSARQRARTAPAVAAVMAAVAGVTTLAIASSSDFEQSRRDYQPTLRPGVTTLEQYDASPDTVRTWRAFDRAAAAAVPGRTVLPIRAPGSPTSSRQLYVAKPGCPALPPVQDDSSSTPEQMACQQWMVADPFNGYGRSEGLVAEPDALSALGIELDAGQRAVLAEGGVLLPLATLVHDGHATLTTYTYTDGGQPTGVRSRVVRAGYLAPFGHAALVDSVVVTPAGATALGLGHHRTGGVLSAGAPIGTATQARLEESVRGVSETAHVYTERGFVESFALPLVGLAAVAVLVVLVGTLTATGLALADSRPDLATLAAVGARPRTRRTMAAAQALVIGLLGAATGVALGLVPGIAAAHPLTSGASSVGGEPVRSGAVIAIPWLLLLAVAVAVPLVAAAAAGIGVRSRLPLTRRLGQ